jgi:tetratricopeptide (TPR) repeat protein/tRNA A-37 threonylcarbamoyl transferase component Bud32
LIGKTISHYRIVEKLGEGGMGVVYIAEDTVLGRRVAIKSLTAAHADQHFRMRFLREAQAVSRLSHPHIATIYDYGETDGGEPYIVMELVKGKTLSALMHDETLTIPRVIEIIKQVAEALAEAHRNGIVHRDIKPSNIAINQRGDVKVLDFGLAKQIDIGPSDPDAHTRLNTQTREGVILGTPMYLSPEQALGVEVDARSDLFSLGSVLYECIAGRPAFSGKSAVEICAKVIQDDPLPPSKFNSGVSSNLDRITLKALAKKSEARYQTADEMIAALESIETRANGTDRTVTRLMSPAPGAHPTGALGTLSDIFKRPRLSIGYVAAGLVVVAGLVFGISRITRATLPPPRPEAQQLYDKGVAALQEGSYFKASKLLERAVGVDDKFALAHARLAEAYTELDLSDKAKDQMLSASRLVADRSLLDRNNALYFDAISATVSRDVPAAIGAYGEITKLKSNDAIAYLDLGRAFESHDEIDKAIEQYSKASDLDHNNPAPLLRLAVLYGRRQDLSNSTASFDRAEGLYKDNQNFEGSSEVSYQRGYLFAQMSKIPEAQKAAEQSLNLAKTAENAYQQVRSLLLLGSIAYLSGNTEQAQPSITQALDLARTNSMEDLATQGLLDLGNSLLLKRAFDDAERYVKQDLELAQRYKEKRNEARANLLLGSIYIQKEDADKGAPFIDQALAFYRGGGYRREVSRCMIMVGREQLLKGDFDNALKTLDQQLQLAKQVEDPGEIARSQSEVAAALAKQDLYPQAVVRYTESYALSKQLNNPLRAAFALLNRGDMLSRLGNYDEAKAAVSELDSYLRSLPEENEYKHIWGAWSHLSLAHMYLGAGDLPGARLECLLALATVSKNDQEIQAEVKATQALIEIRGGTVSLARQLAERAIAMLPKSSVSEHRGNVELALAEVLLEAGDPKTGLEAALRAEQIIATLHETERDWRAWLIAARASDRLASREARRDQLSKSRDLLDNLKKQWPTGSVNSYLGRADIRAYQNQLEQLSSIH